MSDFDAELLSKVEQKFAKYYPLIANGPANAIADDGDAGAAFMDWIASMLCRTTSLLSMVDAAVKAMPANDETNLIGKMMHALVPDITRNVYRAYEFEANQNLLTRAGWQWKVRNFSGRGNLIITDNPICKTRVRTPGGLIVMVPMTRHRIILGGLAHDLAKCRYWSVSIINAILAAWADKHIFAADAETLATVVTNLRGEGPFKKQWCEDARKPFMGLPERIAAGPYPTAADLANLSKDIESEYGPSILEEIRARSK